MSHKNVISITKKFEENNIKTKVEPRGKSVRSAYPKSWDQCGHPPLWNWIIYMDHKVEKNCISIILIFRTCHSLYFIKNIKAYDCCKTRKSRSDSVVWLSCVRLDAWGVVSSCLESNILTQLVSPQPSIFNA